MSSNVSYFFAGLQSFLLERIPQLIQAFNVPNNIIPRTEVVWQWAEPCEVGQEVTFSVLTHYNQANLISDGNHGILVEISVDGVSVPITVDNFDSTRNAVTLVRFTAQISGCYDISIMVHGQHIRGSPFRKLFQPGPVDPLKTTIVNYASTIVVTSNVYHPLKVIARDKYGNTCSPSQQTHSNYELHANKLDAKKTPHDVELVTMDGDSSSSQLEMLIKISEPGCYHGVATYNGVTLKNGKVTIISLLESEAAEVERIVKSKDTSTYYQVKCLPTNTVFDRAKTAYCFVSPKQLTIKEYYLKIIPRQICTFRVRQHTKFFYCDNYSYDPHILTITDGLQPSVTIWCEKRNVLVSLFNRYLQHSFGGSESFHDKRTFFHQQVCAAHASHPFNKIHIKNMDRTNVLKSFMNRTAKFDSSDWCRNFEVSFLYEEGLDWGGVRRELFEILNTELFSPSKDGLFTTFDIENVQALVHPNPKRAERYKLSYYELCGKIVGKCLYDCSRGEAHHLLVKARFSRSFLAQLLGLRVSYEYFSSDDPEFYKTKVRYILDNDIAELKLTFSEEEYGSFGNVIEIVDLKPNGRHIYVTEENKIEYLNTLAQYRLAKKVTSEVDLFMKGLHQLIPENLLAIFDESELELLMCGLGNISVGDMKLNTIVTDSSTSFKRILRWFWTIVATLSQEELARLLQFVTGSSQLPPGGFKELKPCFQISPVPVRNGLPTAHTCFNQLCLPEYESANELKRCLLLAINEGVEGFGFV